MDYSIEQIKEPHESFESYRYKIRKNGKDVALFWHDYRGECEGFKVLPNGKEIEPPFGMCSDFLIGGGPNPTGLSERAKEYIDSQIDEN
jgi:hypothetical protein